MANSTKARAASRRNVHGIGGLHFHVRAFIKAFSGLFTCSESLFPLIVSSGPVDSRIRTRMMDMDGASGSLYVSVAVGTR